LPASAADRSQSACSGLRSFVADQEVCYTFAKVSHETPLMISTSGACGIRSSQMGTFSDTELKSVLIKNVGQILDFVAPQMVDNPRRVV